MEFLVEETLFKIQDDYSIPAYFLRVLNSNINHPLDKIKKPYFEFNYFIVNALLSLNLEKIDKGRGEKSICFLEIEFERNLNKKTFAGIVSVSYITSSLSPNFYKRKILSNWYLDFTNYNTKHGLNEVIIKELNNPTFSPPEFKQALNSRIYPDFAYLIYKIFEEFEKREIEKLQEEEETKFIYYPFLLKNDINNLVGPMGEGKTLWVLSLCYRIQEKIPLLEFSYEDAGSPVYGYQKIYEIEIDDEDRPVCYFSFEGTISEIKEKARCVKEWIKREKNCVYGNTEVKDIEIYQFHGDIINSPIRKTIRKIIANLNPKLVVIDSFMNAFLSFDAVDKTPFVYDFLRSLFKNKGITVLLVTHPSKEDYRQERILPRGAMHHLTYPRVVWGLKRTYEIPFGFAIELSVVKENLGLGKYAYTYGIQFFDHEKRYEIKLLEKKDVKKEARTIENKILSYLQENNLKEFSPVDLSKALQKDNKLVSNTLNKMVSKGLVIKIGRGRFSLIEKRINENETTDINDDKIPF